MKKLFLWLMPILLIIGSTNEANARSKKKKGKAKTEQQTDSVQKKKKSVYDKLLPICQCANSDAVRATNWHISTLAY